MRRVKTTLNALVWCFVIVFFAGIISAKAGSLTPSAAPGSTMNSLEDIFNVLAGTYDSSGDTADADGNISEQLKYIATLGLDNIYTNSSTATITTTDNKDITFALADTATDSDFIVDILGSGNTFEIRDGGLAVLTVADGGDTTIAGDLLADTASSQTIGSSAKPFSSIYVDEVYMSGNSLYMNGVKVLESAAAVMTFSADTDQSLQVETSGSGNMQFTTGGSGNVQFTTNSTGDITFSSNDQIQFTSSNALTLQASAINADIVINALGANSQVQVSAVEEIDLTAPLVDVNGAMVLDSVIDLFSDSAPTINSEGEAAIDTTIADHQGTLVFHNGSAAQYTVALAAGDLPSNDDYVLAYDADNDKYYFKFVSSYYDDIEAPDADSTIAFAGYTNTWTSTLDTGTVFTISNTDSDNFTGATSLIDLKFTNDSDSNGYFLRGYDNSGNDLQWSIGDDGAAFFTGNTGIGAAASSGAKLDITPGSSTGIYIPDITGDTQKGINLVVSADTDDDTTYGVYNTVGTGSGTLSSANRDAIGVYNNVNITSDGSGAPDYYAPTGDAIRNDLSAEADFASIRGVFNQAYTGTSIGATTSIWGFDNLIIPDSVASGALLYGLENSISAANLTGGTATIYGIYNNLVGQGTGTTTMYGLYTQNRTKTGESGYGVYIDNSFGASTGGTQYGFYSNFSDTDVTYYPIYQASNHGNNILYANTRIGGNTDPTNALSVTGAADISTTLEIGGNLTVYEATNDANPEIRIGSADAEELHIQSVYDSGAQTLDYVLFQTDAASATADKGKYTFNVDGSNILNIDDDGLELTGGGKIDTTSNGNITLLPNGSGITIVGDAGSTSHSLNTNDDFFVAGKMEVDGDAYFDGNDVSLGLATLTSGGTNDYGLSISQTLNDSGAAGGSDVYRGIKMDITETDVTGWDDVYLMDLRVNDEGLFRVNDSGDVSINSGSQDEFPYLSLKMGTGYTASGGASALYNYRLPFIEWRNKNDDRAMYMGWGDAATNSNPVFEMTLENGYDLYINGGNTGFGTKDPQNVIDVEGSIAVGTNYSGTYSAPSNGAIFEGNVSIGTNTNSAALHVYGTNNSPRVRVDSNTGYPGFEAYINSGQIFQIQAEATGHAYFDTDGSLYLRPNNIGGGQAAGYIITSQSLKAATGNETAFTIGYTTNKATSGDDTGFLISKTDTASPGTSLLLDAQTGSNSVFKVSDTGTSTFTLGASDQVVIDAATTDSTTSSGVLRLNVDTSQDNQFGMFVDYQIIDDAEADTMYGGIIQIDNDATTTDDTVYGLVLQSVDSGDDDADKVTDILLGLDNADANNPVTTGLLVTSTGGGGVTTAVDASAASIDTALSFGANALDGTYFSVAANTGALTIAADGLGETTESRITLSNSTAATDSVDQGSPAIMFTGQGWNTTAAESQTVDLRMYLLPNKGTTAPYARFTMDYRVDGGAWSNIMSSGYTYAVGDVDFSKNVFAYAYRGLSNQVARIAGRVSDGAGATSVSIMSTSAYSTEGAKIINFYNDFGSTEQAYIDKDGDYYNTGNLTIGTESNGNITISPNGTGVVDLTLGTLTSGGTDDYGLELTHTLNDSGAAGGSDVYRGIKMNITETDVTGWNTVNLMDLQVGGASKFVVSDSGNTIVAALSASGSIKTSSYVSSGSFYKFSGASGADSPGFLSYKTDQAIALALDDTNGTANNRFILIPIDHATGDYGLGTPATNPELRIYSQTDPDISNNQWGGFTHDQENFVINTGANVGTGTGATTDVNGVSIEPSALTSGGTGDFALRVKRTLNDTGAAGGSDLFNGLIMNITETDVTGWDTVNLMDLQVGGDSKFTVTDGANVIIKNGTDPDASVTDSVILYAVDFDDGDASATSELYVRDEDGNETNLSPHNFSMIPEGRSEDLAWVYYSERDGRAISVDMAKVIRVVEELAGKNLIYVKDKNKNKYLDETEYKVPKYLENSQILAGGNSALDNTAADNNTGMYWYLDGYSLVTEKAIAVKAETSEGDRLLYASLSDKAEVSISGSAELTGGTKTINFDDIDPTFKELISHRVPFRVIITPTAESNGLYVADKISTLTSLGEPEFQGFKVKESNGGNSDASFDWMVIARRAGFEDQEEIVESMEPTNPAPEDSGDPVLGCMEEEALNYNPNATQNDGSCEYGEEEPVAEVLGCTDETALNYNADATSDDGSCEYEEESEEIVGCTDSEALNYNADATTDDGSCEYEQVEVLGCTDETATNYNSEATLDDGSCEYEPVEVPGCTDSEALNYNADATTDDGFCEYEQVEVLGCTDETATNYNSEATLDDGSCEY